MENLFFAFCVKIVAETIWSSSVHVIYRHIDQVVYCHETLPLNMDMTC